MMMSQPAYQALLPARESGIPLSGQLAYAAGGISFTIVERLLTLWLAFYYLDEASPGHVALSASAFFGILWIGRIADAVTDPLVASLSDRARSRLGRRRTFMLCGGLPMCLFGMLVFFPPAASVPVVALFLGAGLCLFWACFTIYAVAYLALMSELAATHRTRVHLATLKASAALLGAALVFVLSPHLVALVGFGPMVALLAGIALLFAYVPVLGVDERRYASSRRSTTPLWSSVRLTLTDRPYQRYLVSFLLFWLGFNFVTTGIPFYVRHLLQQPESTAGSLLGFTFGAALVCFALINRLALRIGLRRTYLLCMAAFALVLPLIYLWEMPPLGLSRLALARAVMALAGIPVAGLFAIPDAIVSRLSRAAADQEGEGREAMYFGVQGFCLKLAFGLSGSLMGLLFDLFGKGGSQANLGLKLTAPVGGLLVATGMLLFWRFPGGAEELLDDVR